MSILWSFIVGKYRMALAGFLTGLGAVLALFAYGWSKKREGASEAATKALKQDAIKLEKAREAAYKEKRDVDGVSDSDLVDRLRRRDNDWGKL